jgi:hypothetical protein
MFRISMDDADILFSGAKRLSSKSTLNEKWALLHLLTIKSYL